MTNRRILELLKIERECVKRGENRKCNECDLVQNTDELLEMYDSLIFGVEMRVEMDDEERDKRMLELAKRLFG